MRKRRIDGEELDDAIVDSIDSVGACGATLSGIRTVALSYFDEEVLISAVDVKNAVRRLVRDGELETRGRVSGGSIRYGTKSDMTLIGWGA